ncbi:hypothetical protein, partial [Prevotella sp. CAG:255]|uniref:hypothetical protein n=1 Tax=Prevotella sp. CAG:255 TaxID=1262923 RepID=UPI00258D35EF
MSEVHHHNFRFHLTVSFLCLFAVLRLQSHKLLDRNTSGINPKNCRTEQERAEESKVRHEKSALLMLRSKFPKSYGWRR